MALPQICEQIGQDGYKINGFSSLENWSYTFHVSEFFAFFQSI